MAIRFVLAAIVMFTSYLSAENPTPHVLIMVRPTYFAFNPETAKTNHYGDSDNSSNVSARAKREFDKAVEKLREHDLDVIVLESPENAPDAVFPNNWFSLHLDTSKENQHLLMLYPMLTRNRAIERENHSALIQSLSSKGITINNKYDFSHHEHKSLALEGTGSLVFDPGSNLVFMSRSQRSNEAIARDVCEVLDKKLVPFDSVDPRGNPIYHTNVMMSVGRDYAVICGESLPNPQEQGMVYRNLQQSKQVFVEISQKQVEKMCGNIIEAVSTAGKKYIIMSRTAYDSFTKEQLSSLSK